MRTTGRILRALLAASIPAAASPFAMAGDRALGEYLSSECVTCHQLTGQVTGAIPSIIGWPDDQFVAVLLAYKRHERENQVMRTLAARLTEEEMAALAAYFGSLPYQPRIR